MNERNARLLRAWAEYHGGPGGENDEVIKNLLPALKCSLTTLPGRERGRLAARMRSDILRARTPKFRRNLLPRSAR